MGDLKATLADQLEALDRCKTSAENMLIETYRTLKRDLEEQSAMQKELADKPIHEFIEKSEAAASIRIHTTYSSVNLGVMVDGRHFGMRYPLAEPIPPGEYTVLIMFHKVKSDV